MELLNNEENDSFRLEVSFNSGVLFMEDGLLITAENLLAVAFLPLRDFLAVYKCTPIVVANLTADRILALLTELLPEGLFIVRNGRDI